MPDLKVLEFVGGRPQPRAEVLIPLDSNGQFIDDPTFVSGVDRVNQDVVKGLLTTVGSNFLAPGYGTNLNSLIRSRRLDLVADSITASVQSVLGYLSGFLSQEDPSEQITELVNLQAIESTDTIEMSMTIRTGTNVTSTVAIV